MADEFWEENVPASKEYDRPGNVDEQVIKDISAWIRNPGR